MQNACEMKVPEGIRTFLCQSWYYKGILETFCRKVQNTILFFIFYLRKSVPFYIPNRWCGAYCWNIQHIRQGHAANLPAYRNSWAKGLPVSCRKRTIQQRLCQTVFPGFENYDFTFRFRKCFPGMNDADCVPVNRRLISAFTLPTLPDRLSSKADSPASVNLIYDSEFLICNQKFPCYLTPIGRM